MNLNFRRRKKDQTSKTLFERLMEATDNSPFSAATKLFGNKQSVNINTDDLPGRVWSENRKKEFEGVQGLTVKPSKNGTGWRYSDGSSYTDYDLLEEGTIAKQSIDGGLKNGNFRLVNFYKPDGTTFRAIEPVPRSNDVVISIAEQKEVRKQAGLRL